MGLGMIMRRALSQLLPEVDPETGLELKWFTWEMIPGNLIIGVGGCKMGKQANVSQYRVHYLGFIGAVQNTPQGLRNCLFTNSRVLRVPPGNIHSLAITDSPAYSEQGLSKFLWSESALWPLAGRNCSCVK